MREHPAKRFKLEGDTASCRREALPRRMDEDCTAAPGNTWTRIVVNLDDEIVEIVVAGQAVNARMRRHFNRPVIVPIHGVFAPAIVPRYSLHRQ